MTPPEEQTPLLATTTSASEAASESEELLQRRRKRCLLLAGCASGLLSSLIFACYNMAVKTWHLDFVDVLFIRASIQTFMFGTLGYFFHQQFWPNYAELEDKRTYYLQCFLLIFQVSVKFSV